MPPRLDIHEIAAAGFQAGSEVYKRGRPDYPVEAVKLLIDTLKTDSTTSGVELGAGTGKFTRMLVSRAGAEVIAVEPVETLPCRTDVYRSRKIG